MGGSAYIIFVTVMVATGIMSPESQKASNSPHAIIERERESKPHRCEPTGVE